MLTRKEKRLANNRAKINLYIIKLEENLSNFDCAENISNFKQEVNAFSNISAQKIFRMRIQLFFALFVQTSLSSSKTPQHLYCYAERNVSSGILYLGESFVRSGAIKDLRV